MKPVSGTDPRATLSVVIPVYNSRAYLPELIASILTQTRPADEVIFVDDGSSDGSPELIQRLAAGLNGLRIAPQVNQGPAAARNHGIAMATGRYVALIDSDDILDPAMFATLVDAAERDTLDMAMGNAWNYHEGRKPDTQVFDGVADTGVITGETWFQQRWLARYLPHYCWMAIYRREFLQRHEFRFPLIELHEDVLWVTQTLLAAKRFRYLPVPLIRYRKKLQWAQPPSSGGTSGFQHHRQVDSAFHNTVALSKIANDESLQPLTRQLIRSDFVNGGCNLIRQIRRLPDVAQRRHYLERVRNEELVKLLWQNAYGFAQRARVARYGLLSKIG
jgi:glycosyltransferase involved in cell wall biosynthesis